MKRYYYDGYNLDKNYATLWNGFLEYNSNTIELTEDRIEKNTNRELDDLLTDICNINFYIYILDSKIYISLCQDSKYYYYQFEKDIKLIIDKIENQFNIKIDNGEFNATELKHQGNQYKYSISKDIDSKIILKK
jgi:hypothetical protein